MQTHLPPEAFTKETLQEAFQWLQSQPDSVRELVHTPESLVSLYRKAQRQNPDAPVSSKNFMNELKTLAKGLEAFSDPPTQTPAKQPTAKLKFEKTTPPIEKTIKPEPQKTLSSPQPVLGLNLDQKSIQSISEVQRRFNLSSENEALRLLIALGYEKFNSFN